MRWLIYAVLGYLAWQALRRWRDRREQGGLLRGHGLPVLERRWLTLEPELADWVSDAVPYRPLDPRTFSLLTRALSRVVVLRRLARDPEQLTPGGTWLPPWRVRELVGEQCVQAHRAFHSFIYALPPTASPERHRELAGRLQLLLQRVRKDVDRETRHSARAGVNTESGLAMPAGHHPGAFDPLESPHEPSFHPARL